MPAAEGESVIVELGSDSSLDGDSDLPPESCSSSTSATSAQLDASATTKPCATVTQKHQTEAENDVLWHMMQSLQKKRTRLDAGNHVQFCQSMLRTLGQGYSSLDASKTWIFYWNIHALNLLHNPVPQDLIDRIGNYILLCQQPDGGFGGSPKHSSHVASTFAALSALASLPDNGGFLSKIRKQSLYEYLLARRQSDGSFELHYEGEVDIRGAYCALASAAIAGILSKELCEGVARWVLQCQTYEGGFGGEIGAEAHGAYTYCGVATLALLDEKGSMDILRLKRWLVQRQMQLEGGFSGRSNKLVDSCYTFWVGAVEAVLLQKQWISAPFLNHKAKERYVLCACQHPAGGLRDKPAKYPDPYHTCYSLSGLAAFRQSGIGLTQTDAILNLKLGWQEDHAFNDSTSSTK